jgi:holo-[acyl-carrier protein] synthase
MRCGIDTVDVARIKRLQQTLTDTQRAEIYSPDEIAYCLAHENPWPYFAARFAAKEAALKCFPAATAKQAVAFNAFCIEHDNYGAPRFQSNAAIEQLMQDNALTEICVSLTHTQSQALAMVVVK